MTPAAAQSIVRRRQKARRDYSAFAALLDTPGNLVTGVTLPAAAEVYVSTTSALLATTNLLTVAPARALAAPAQAAGAKHHAGRLGATAAVSKAAGAPGTVSLYVRDPAGVPRLIAQG